MIRKEFTMKDSIRCFDKNCKRPSASLCRWPRWSNLQVLMSSGLAFSCIFMVSGRALAAEYYVSPTGIDSNPGTLALPFATLQKGNNSASAGDTIWLRGGTYSSTSQITLSKSGTSDTNRTKIWAYQNEVPVLDFSKYATTNKAVDVPAILVTGSWMHLKGLEIANGAVGASGDHSYSMLRTKNASNNTFELLNIHHGFGPGLFIDTGTGGNLILNCDSHDNYDKDGSQGDGQNGDGFGVHYQTTGPSTIIRGCRAWINSDDGYDFISQEVPVTIENSWAVHNGYANGGSTSPSSGNGNGFKIGSSQTGIRHIVQNNVAWKNKAAGFYANHSSGGNTWLNNTSYSNGTQYNMLASPAGDSSSTIILSGSLVHKMRNNIGFPNKNTNMGGVDTATNTWDLGITEASSDFASTSDTGYTDPRQADGSMPAIDFLKLKTGSPLIDKGTDVGLPFVGAAPDLGAYEYGAVSANGTGGNTTNAGGSTGSGGNISTGGNTGTGGSPRSDASTGSGGNDGATTAGTTGTTGGTSGNGGSVTVGTGGSTGTGGLISAGGNQGSGGNIAAGSGGLSNGSGAGTGGAKGTGATSASTAGAAVSSNGCSCAVGSRPPHHGILAFFMVGVFALLARRRRNRAETQDCAADA
jgi:MYXO-CTERM domain-containing protein